MRLKKVMYGCRVRKNWRGIYFWVEASPGHILDTGLLEMKGMDIISHMIPHCNGFGLQIFPPKFLVLGRLFENLGDIAKKLGPPCTF